MNKNEYNELSKKIDEIIDVKDKSKQLIELRSFLVNGFTEEDAPVDLFNFDDKMLVQLRDDPALRFYNDRELPETYLKLRHRIQCDYNYVIVKDLAEELDKRMLEQELTKNMTRTKYENEHKTRINYYGRAYLERQVFETWDIAHQ